MQTQDTLSLITAKDFDASVFDQEGEQLASEILQVLMSMQDNNQPLKKGGSQIAYRCDLLILLNRQRFDVSENTLFDIICGHIGSHPDDSVYEISIKDIKQLLGEYNSSNLYKVMRTAIDTITDKPLLFKNTRSKKSNDFIKIPWYSALRYVDKDVTGKESVIRFVPTKFFKSLLLSASVTHGAFYRINVSARIQSKYVRTLFYYLVSRRTYKDSPAGKPGVFTTPLSEFQMIVGYPDNYEIKDVRRQILEAAQKKFDSIAECDFNFTFTFPKEPSEGKTRGYTHISFNIYNKKDVIKQDENAHVIEQTQMSIFDIVEPDNDQTEDNRSEDAELERLLSQITMTDSEKKYIISKYHNNGRDLPFMEKAIEKVINSKGVDSEAALLQYMMESGYTPCAERNKENKKKSSYTGIAERDYDFDELEKQLVNN